MRIGKWNVFNLAGCILFAVWGILYEVSPSAGRETTPVLLGSAIACFVVAIISEIIALSRNKR